MPCPRPHLGKSRTFLSSGEPLAVCCRLLLVGRTRERFKMSYHSGLGGQCGDDQNEAWGKYTSDTHTQPVRAMGA